MEAPTTNFCDASTSDPNMSMIISNECDEYLQLQGSRRRKIRNEDELVVIDDEDGSPGGPPLAPIIARIMADPSQVAPSAPITAFGLTNPKKPRKQQKRKEPKPSTRSTDAGMSFLSGMFPSLTGEELVKLSTLLQMVANSSKSMPDSPSWTSVLISQDDKAFLRRKWLEREESALQAGVAKYGTGKWKAIKRDPMLGGHLENRTNAQLKDKWRNMVLGLERSKEEHLVFARTVEEDGLADHSNREGDYDSVVVLIGPGSNQSQEPQQI